MTLSLLAHDPTTDEIGVAIASLRFSVAQSVVTTSAGVGIACSQHLPSPTFGRLALQRLREAETVERCIAEATRLDLANAVRQLALINVRGEIAAHTGAACVGAAAHVIRAGRSAQGAILVEASVLDVALDAFDAATGSLEQRLLVGLSSGVQAGGDQRGHRSAAVIVVPNDPNAAPDARSVDLQVHDHDDPLRELSRLVQLRALDAEVLSALDIALAGDVATAIVRFDALERRAPELVDAACLHAMLLATAGKFEQARERFRVPFASDASWIRYATRLRASGFLPLAPEDMARLTLDPAAEFAD